MSTQGRTAHHTGTHAVGVKIAKVEFSRHMLEQAALKGFTKDQIIRALTRPYKVTAVTEHPGQQRFCGRGVDGLPGVAVVLAPLAPKNGQGGYWRAVTLYADGIVTEMREDQKSDPRALASKRLAGAL